MRLDSGDWVLEATPDRGAAITALRHAGRDLLGPQGAFWMLPWANRLDGGRFGGLHRLPVNEPALGHALHGLGRDRPWVVEAAGPDHAVLAQALSHPPFTYAARLEMALSASGLSLSLALRNAGPEACPMGFGWHPWFLRPEGCRVHFAATTAFRADDRRLPVEALPSSGIAGGEAGWIGLDGHFAGWDGQAELRRPDLTLLLRASGDWARNLHFFAPRDRAVICLEPVSHVPDVINRPQFARFGAMRALAPGEALAGSIHLSLGPAAI